MRDLNSIFLVEAIDLTNQLESTLLTIEKTTDRNSAIATLFRAMHTLKGSSGMFSIESIFNLTHELETIYDDIRECKRELTNEIIAISLESIDHIRNILNDLEISTPELQQHQELLLSKVKQMAMISVRQPTVPILEDGYQNLSYSYYIHFLPHPHLLKKGANPLYLVDDVLALGQGKCYPYFNSLPPLETISDTCITGFEFILTTRENTNSIRDVFMFVEGECELQIEKFSDDSVPKYLPDPDGRFVKMGWDYFSKIDRSKSTDKSERKIKKSNHSTMRVDSKRLDDLMNLVSELVTTQAGLSLIAKQQSDNRLTTIAESIEKLTGRLRDNALSLTLIPFETLIVKFQRMVRDLSASLGKKVTLSTEGTDTELDKFIIDKLSDPLLHILRNSIDHGIEKPDERLRLGKHEAGLITIKAYYSGAFITIEITDDGNGISIEKVKAKAIEKGLLSTHNHFTEQELINLIFHPGFSTAEEVTGVSGRGVGMDVVRKNIDDLRGEISIKTKSGSGTCFTIKLPLTLSIIDGLEVAVGNTHFVIPVFSILKCYEHSTENLVASFNKWITLEERRTPFVMMRDEILTAQPAPEFSQIICVPYEGKIAGLVVDRIVGQVQAVLKPLGVFYKDQDEYSGATILGDGSVALVIDTHKIVRKFSYQEIRKSEIYEHAS